MERAAGVTWREDYGTPLKVPVWTESKKEREAKAKGEPARVVSLEELAKHDKEDDCWIVVHDRVYDASGFIKQHPGGFLPLKAFAGKRDATDAFEAFHPARVHATLLPCMFVGWLDVEPSTGNNPVESKLIEEESKASECARTEEEKVDKAMREIRQILLERGLFHSTASYYIKLFSFFAALFGLGLYFTLATPYYWLGAIFMGLFWQQVAFVGHDIGHNAIMNKRDKNLFWGVLIGNTLMGISLGWWKQSHNVHHVVCNSVEHDPDIQHMPVFAVHGRLFDRGGFFSTYHKKRFDMDFFARLLVRIQHLLFYPVMAVARVNLYAQSWINLIIQPHGRVPYRELEMATLLAFFGWLGLLVSTLPTTNERILWIVISHAVSGLLHLQICLSHFPMEVHREDDEGRAQGFYTLQLQTTLNVDTWTWMDFVHGGLQFQVEHHMFPRLPRHNLREARRLVREKLAEIGAMHRYNEMGFIEGNLHLMHTMQAAAQECAKLKKGDGGFYVSPLYHGLNLDG